MVDICMKYIPKESYALMLTDAEEHIRDFGRVITGKKDKQT
jgi:hypothetical protein